jgi:hypothetical protein
LSWLRNTISARCASRTTVADRPRIVRRCWWRFCFTVRHRRASRKIEKATYDSNSVAFRFIAANKHPDHDTIAAFPRPFLPHLETIFNQLLLLAKELKCLEVGRVSLDGTKIKANASKYRALSLKGADRLEAQLRREVKRVLELAEEADQADEAAGEGLDIPEELARREDRLKVIAEA